MLDPKLIRNDPDLVREALKQRAADELLSRVDEILDLDAGRRAALNEVNDLKAERNEVSKRIGDMKQRGEDAVDLIAEMRRVGDRPAAILTLAGVAPDPVGGAPCGLQGPFLAKPTTELTQGDQADEFGGGRFARAVKSAKAELVANVETAVRPLDLEQQRENCVRPCLPALLASCIPHAQGGEQCLIQSLAAVTNVRGAE